MSKRNSRKSKSKSRGNGKFSKSRQNKGHRGPKGRKSSMGIKNFDKQHNKKYIGFNKLSKQVARRYEEKGMKPAKAMEIGRRVAGKVYSKKLKEGA